MSTIIENPPTPVTTDERVLNLIPTPDTTRDWQLADAVAAGDLTAAASLPAQVDLRADWWSINDQLDTGSCVGWATADGVMRHTLVKAGMIELSEKLSPRFIWMGAKETDEFTARPETFVEAGGTSLKAAVTICQRFGIVTEEVLPFRISTTMYTGSENALYATAATRRVRYYNLGKNIDQWKSWLATNGPILVGLSVDSGWDGATANRGLVSRFDPSTVRGGHAVCLVGYRSDGTFIVRNSWGTSWGDAGFAYVTPEYVANAFFPESYGVQL